MLINDYDDVLDILYEMLYEEGREVYLNNGLFLDCRGSLCGLSL